MNKYMIIVLFTLTTAGITTAETGTYLMRIDPTQSTIERNHSIGDMLFSPNYDISGTFTMVVNDGRISFDDIDTSTRSPMPKPRGPHDISIVPHFPSPQWPDLFGGTSSVSLLLHQMLDHIEGLYDGQTSDIRSRRFAFGNLLHTGTFDGDQLELDLWKIDRLPSPQDIEFINQNLEWGRPYDITYLHIVANVIPEPASFGLVTAGLLILMPRPHRPAVQIRHRGSDTPGWT